MISSEVQRTLVKSPPELWSELSDPAALARHLGELGEIRIVRMEAEKTVEWAAEHTTGTVSLQPSGWGTKVTLSVTRERVAAPTPSPAEQESAEPTDTAESEPSELENAEPTDSAEPPDTAEPTDIAESTATAQPQVAEIEATAEIAPASEDSQQPPAEDVPEPAAAAARRGFFARLFRRRRREETAEPQSEAIAPTPQPGPADAFAAVSEALAQGAKDSHAFADPPTPAALATASEHTEPSVPKHETQAEQSADIAAELMAAEEVAADEVAAEEVTAVLAAVLDRLGAAHHRPFSRS
ncbi:MAG TPA: hypothetical protein VIH92_01390 [Solirubrobacteraceae bacterium]